MYIARNAESHSVLNHASRLRRVRKTGGTVGYRELNERKEKEENPTDDFYSDQWR